MYVHPPQRSLMPTQAIRLPIGFDIPIALSHALLFSERATLGDDRAGELKQQAVAGSVGDAATVLVDQPVDQFLSMGAQGA